MFVGGISCPVCTPRSIVREGRGMPRREAGEIAGQAVTRRDRELHGVRGGVRALRQGRLTQLEQARVQHGKPVVDPGEDGQARNAPCRDPKAWSWSPSEDPRAAKKRWDPRKGEGRGSSSKRRRRSRSTSPCPVGTALIPVTAAASCSSGADVSGATDELVLFLNWMRKEYKVPEESRMSTA